MSHLPLCSGDLDANNPSHTQFAQSFVAELLQEIEGKLKYEDDFLMRARLEEAAAHFTVSADVAAHFTVSLR